MNPLTHQENKQTLYNIASVQQQLQQQQHDDNLPKEEYQMVLVQDPNATFSHQQQLLPISIQQQNYQFHNFVPVEVRAGTTYAFEQKPVVRSSSFSSYDHYPTHFTERGFQFRSANNYIPQNPHPSFSAVSSNTSNTNPSSNVQNNSILNTITSQNPIAHHLQQSTNNNNSPMSYSSPLVENSGTSRDGSNTPPSPNQQGKPFESSLIQRLSPARKRSNSEPTNSRSGKLKKKRSCARWTEEENKKLIEAYIKYEGKNWSAIAKTVGNKTSDQCNQHWWRVLNPEICKQPWGNDEDQLLYDRVQEFGESSWKKVSQGLRGRTDLQCRHRWNQLKKLSKKTPGSSTPPLVLDNPTLSDIQDGCIVENNSTPINTSSATSDLMRVAGYYQLSQGEEQLSTTTTGITTTTSTQEVSSPPRKVQQQPQVALQEPVAQQGIYQDFYFQQPMVSTQVQYQPNHVDYRETVVAEGDVPSMVVYQAQPLQHIQQIQPIQQMQQIQPMQHIQTIQSIQPMQTIQTIQGMQPIQTIHTIQPIQHIQTIQPVGHHQPHTGLYHYSFPVYQQPMTTQSYYQTTADTQQYSEQHQNGDEFFEPVQDGVNGEENNQVDIDILEAVLQNQSRMENRDEIFETTQEQREGHYY